MACFYLLEYKNLSPPLSNHHHKTSKAQLSTLQQTEIHTTSSIMKFTILPTLAFALAGTASAAECYFQSGSQRCASWDGMWRFRDDFCKNHWQGGSDNVLYNDGNGFSARIRRDGFTSQQQCWDSTGRSLRQLVRSNQRDDS